MTISYSGSFFRLLLRWKGSIWRSVWKELILYLSFFFGIRLFYTHGIDSIAKDEGTVIRWKQIFEIICRRFDGYCRLIPLTFLLGFYVSNVVSRWWRQFECLAWPEDFVTGLCTVITKHDDQSQKRIHQITRYINLAAALAWRDISSKIRLRFPNVSSLVLAGLLTEKEFEYLEKANESCETLRWLTPLHWIQQLIKKEEEENKPNASQLNALLLELKNYRQSLRRLFCYDWVCVPLVYTQVAALATYAFFFFALFGRQTLLSDIEGGKEVEMIIPIFLIVQFLFFVGWFKVGQDLMRPFGLDDDDLELNYILDRNIQTTFAIISRLHMADPHGPVPNASELRSSEQNLPTSGEPVAAPIDGAASGLKEPAFGNQGKNQGPLRDDGVELYSEKTGKSKTESSKYKKGKTESSEESKPKKKKKKPRVNKTKWHSILILSIVVLIVSFAIAGLCAAHHWGEARVIAVLAP